MFYFVIFKNNLLLFSELRCCIYLIYYNFESVMEVIIIEKEAFYKLLDEVIMKVKENLKIEKEWITEKELMSILNIKSKSTIQKLRNQGEIEYSQPVRKLILYSSKSVKKFIEKYKQVAFDDM